MSYIGLINTIPVYSTSAEAVLWAKQYNLTGFHEHTLNGVLGYMGGATHAQINAAVLLGVQTLLTSAELALGQFVVTLRERQAYASAPVVVSAPVASITVNVGESTGDANDSTFVPPTVTVQYSGTNNSSGGGGSSTTSGGGSGGGY